MKRQYFFMLVCWFLLMIPQLVATVYDLSWCTVDGGGGQSNGGSYVLTGTAGQSDAGMASNGGYTVRSGFWNFMPEINVKQGTTNISNGTGSYNFGSVSIGSSSSVITFTIENTGDANLSLSGIQKSGDNPGDFTITQPVRSTITPGGFTTFTISFAPTTAGTRTATISINNTDSDENPYTFTVTGTGTAQSGNSYLLWTK